MPVPAPSIVPARSDGSGRRSKQLEVGLASRKAATGGSAQPKRRKRRKGSSRRMAPLARRGRTMHGRRADLLQLRILASYLPLRSSSARPSRPHHVGRSRLLQHMLYWVPWRLPSLTRPPPRVADMVDDAEEGAEAEIGEEHRAYGFLNQVRRFTQSAIKNTPFSRQG